MAEHLRAADADTAALQARLDALESETHSLREVLTERLKRDSLDEALPTGRGQRRSRDKPRGSRSSRGSFRPRSRSPEPPSGGRFRWVRGDDDAKSLARLVVGAAMPDAVVGFPVDLHAKYEANVNTALKGVAIAARRCLEDRDLHLACAPRFRDNRNELTASVYPLLERPPDPDAPDVEVLTVARATDYRVLAGAVAKRARDGQTSRLRAIGAAAVFTAARAVATAREYLADDATRSSVACVPRFATVQFDGRAEETTILEVVVFRVAVAADD